MAGPLRYFSAQPEGLGVAEVVSKSGWAGGGCEESRYFCAQLEVGAGEAGPGNWGEADSTGGGDGDESRYFCAQPGSGDKVGSDLVSNELLEVLSFI